MRDLIRSAARRLLKSRGASSDYQILQDLPAAGDMHGWHDDEVAQRQQDAFQPLLQEMRSGKLRRDFAALAEAMQLTNIPNPVTLEVGCGGGWNSEVIENALKSDIRYVGLDYSLAMIRVASQSYPAKPFVAGDAYTLPFGDGAFDVVLSGTVLMHLPHYEMAIRECRRVSRNACIFHTVPVVAGRPTTFLSKNAYGRPVVEVVFNEAELLECLNRSGLRVRRILPSIDYDLREIIGEPTSTQTYWCDIQ